MAFASVNRSIGLAEILRNSPEFVGPKPENSSGAVNGFDMSHVALSEALCGEELPGFTPALFMSVTVLNAVMKRVASAVGRPVSLSCRIGTNSHCRVTTESPFGAGASLDTIRRFEFWWL